MILNGSKLEIINKSLSTPKGKITRKQAESIHKDLPEGGMWRTIMGHHVYILNHKVIAGSIPGMRTLAKKATKKHLDMYQAHIDKENGKGAKKNGSTKKPAKATTGAGRGSKTKSSPDKPASTSKTKPSKKQSGTKSDKSSSKTKQVSPPTTPMYLGNAKQVPKPKAPKEAPKKTGSLKQALKNTPKKKAPAKTPSKSKDIRTDVQKNRDIAYDAGEKIGGARKDTFIKSFRQDPNQQNLQKLIEVSPESAIKLVNKKNVMKPVDHGQDYKNGVDIKTSVLKALIYGRVAPKPKSESKEDLVGYLKGITDLQRHLEGVKDFDQMVNAIRELRNLAHTGKRGREAEESIAKYKDSPSRYSYFNDELHNRQAEEGKKARAMMDLSPLGENLENFFTSYKSFDSTMTTLRKKKLSWDTFFDKDEAKTGEKKKPESQKKKWERRAVSEHERKGGRATKVSKPEDMLKDFGIKGVEFGHWVDDSAGKYHLKRSAEAFQDLADTLDINDKDISLNGRLSIAFGARGSGGALAHYEPDRKAINMTKFGGAGSLAHEWGHAMDNILYQYSHGGKPSIMFASGGMMGHEDPVLHSMYSDLMKSIMSPPKGEKGGVRKITLDSSANSPSKYYPEMRRDVNEGMSPEDVYKKWAEKLTGRIDREMDAVRSNPMRSQESKNKELKKLESNKKRTLNAIPAYLAYELKLKQNNGSYSGPDYKGDLEIPTGTSEYYQRMKEMDGGSSKPYWSASEEMFARVFESYVEDKMNKNKRMNNYLVWDTKTKRGTDAPFPVGKERDEMTKKMDDLVKYVSKYKVLKKALRMIDGPKLTIDLRKSHIDLRKSHIDYEDRLRKLKERRTEKAPGSTHLSNAEELRSYALNKARNAYNVPNPEAVIYIPINRLKTPYQTEEATNWDKVSENVTKMEWGQHLEPLVIGYDYDIHDGHHRYEASKMMDYTHVPCVVGGSNELDKQRAEESYREIWKSIVPDYANNSAFPDADELVFRGIGQKELDFIKRTGFIQSKSKGNDDDVTGKTCFSSLYQQALGYARTNYSEYNEPQAYVIAVPHYWYIMEDEKGEMVSDRPVPADNMMVEPIPREDYEKQDFR